MAAETFQFTGTDKAGHPLDLSLTLNHQTPAAGLKTIGMSAPSSLWSQRLAEVGPAGVKARRIFADLTSTGQDQASLIGAAVSAGMLPVVSYKLPVSGGAYRITEALAGSFDAWVNSLGNYLDGLNVPVAAVFHHEPRGDLTPAQFIALNKRYTPLVRKSSDIKVGCFLNGFLLDGSSSAQAEFASYTDATLLNLWDWFGIDAYHAGTITDPDPVKTPGARIRLTCEWLQARGLPDKPVGIGEYNGHTAAAVADAGEASLSEAQVWFSCVWNSDGGSFSPLTGTRLTAFQATKADPRARQ